MKINEIIREKRIEKGLTQEQMASYLGLSAPAVNKWEKGASYPDITLLPALARLLDTDLNTLLSFQDNLSQQEIGNFLNELTADAAANGARHAFDMAMDKIREYPSCDILILNAALTLDGILTLYAEAEKNPPFDFSEEIEKLYIRTAKSKDMQVKNQAKVMLIYRHMGRQEFEKAEILLDELPDEASFHKKQLQASLYMRQENWEKAARLTEQALLSNITAVCSSLYTLTEIALNEERIDDARAIANISQQMVPLFHLWEYNSYVADFQIAVVQKDTDGCIAVLKKMLPAIQKKWNIADSPLYCHIPQKEHPENLGDLMLPKILSELEDIREHEYDFLRSCPDFNRFLSEFKAKIH